MRRGINIRKKKRIILNNINKKALITLIVSISIISVCLFISYFFIQNILIKKNFEYDSVHFSELNEDIPFSIKKILLFSSATATAGSINQSLSLTISNYCDIGIYLNKLNDTNISISSLYIDNISISTPANGTPYLYSKAVSDFGRCSFDENSIINNRFNFNIISKEFELDYNNYEIYNDGSTPISLGLYNKNIKSDFISDNTNISYNGTLLKDAVILTSDINCSISFVINIVTDSNAHYMCNVNFDIPFEDEHGSIYTTGYVTKEFKNEETNKFIRIN